ncbi:MAG: hypothetical protein RSB71_00465, partial [Bacilli bacterium]
MTKEEILTQLRQLQSKIPVNISETKRGVNEIEEITAIIENKREYEAQLEALNEKLNDDSNYEANNYLKAGNKLFDIQSQINKINEDEIDNQSNIYDYNYRLGIINSEVDASNYLISEGNKELEELNKIQQNFPNLKQNKQYEEQIARTKKAIEDIKTYSDILKQEKDIISVYLETANTHIKALSNRKERYNQLMSNLENNSIGIDIVKKNQDFLKRDELQRFISAFDARNTYLNFDFSKELTNIIKEFKEDNISQEDIVRRLKACRNDLDQVKNDQNQVKNDQ